MMLEFRPLERYPFHDFDGAVFVIPVDQFPQAKGEDLSFPDTTHDYYLAIGQIRDDLEVLIIGTLQESSGDYEITDQYTYYVPLSLLSGVSAALLPHTRNFSREPLYLSVMSEVLQRKARQAQRLDRELDELRLPSHPDSVLAAILSEDGQQLLHMISVDHLALVGPALYRAVVHLSKPELPQYTSGSTVYLHKLDAKASPWAKHTLLVLLPEPPVLAEFALRPAPQDEVLSCYVGTCQSCDKRQLIHLGPDPEYSDIAQLAKEIEAGLWGIPLYAFAVEHLEAQVSNSRAAYHCTFCGAWEVRRRIRLRDGRATCERQPTCSSCGHKLFRFKERIEQAQFPCRSCGEIVVWQHLDTASVPAELAWEAEHPAYLADDFEVLTLAEMEWVERDFEP